MPDILTAVTDAESKVVDGLRSLQKPVVGYVRKGVEFADSRLPSIDFTYPQSLPSPTKVVDTQVDFMKSLLDTQRDLVKAVIKTVAPLAGGESSSSKPKSRSTKA
jgi:hypothetical protein